MMLPESTVLGRLRIVEIYEFSQKPVLFACKNTTGHIYLAVWIDETDENDVWLYTSSVSPERFARMRHREVERWVPPPGDYVDIPESLPRIVWENVDQRDRHVVSQDNSKTRESA